MGEVTKEYLIDNYIDKDLKFALMPLHIIDVIMGQPKYSIRNNFVVPSERMTVLRCSIVISIFLFSLYYNAMNHYNNDRSLVSIFLQLYPYISLLKNVVILVVLHVLNFRNAQKNITVIMNIQRARLSLKNIPENSLRKITIFNWFVFVYNVGDILFDTYFLINVKRKDFMMTVTSILHNMIRHYLDTKILYGFVVAKLLSSTLSFWIEDFKSLILLEDRKDSDPINRVDMRIRRQQALKSFRDLAGSYTAFTGSFGVTVVVYTCGYFIKIMIFVALVVDLQKKHIFLEFFDSILNSSYNSTWIVRNLILIMLLSYELDKFYRATDTCRVECLLLLKKSYCSDASRELCKNVIRLLNNKFAVMKPLSVFTVNSKLPMRIIEAAATFSIMMLQFLGK